MFRRPHDPTTGSYTPQPLYSVTKVQCLTKKSLNFHATNNMHPFCLITSRQQAVRYKRHRLEESRRLATAWEIPWLNILPRLQVERKSWDTRHMSIEQCGPDMYAARLISCRRRRGSRPACTFADHVVKEGICIPTTNGMCWQIAEAEQFYCGEDKLWRTSKARDSSCSSYGFQSEVS